MQSIPLLPAIFFALISSAVAEVPFAPLADQPDSVVTMVVTEDIRNIAARNVTHHGKWTRIDSVHRSGVKEITEYIRQSICVYSFSW